MNNAVNFILESGVSLSLLSLIYILFLRKETFFRLNRIFLLVSVLFSIVLPFLKFRIYEAQPTMLAEVTVTPYRNLMEAVTVYGQDLSGTVVQTISSSQLIIMIYLAGLLLFLGRFLFRLIQIGLLIKRNPVKKAGAIKFVTINKQFSPFSFLRYIFISPQTKQEDGYEKMVTHEMEHIKQGHTFDVLILELMTVLQWFNPFMWILKRVIRENHEYLADIAVLNSGISRAHYKQLLLNQVVGYQLDMANNFNSSLIKSRIKMISKIRSSKKANLKFLFGILTFLALVVAFACEQKEIAEPAEIIPINEETVKLTIKDNKIKVIGDPEELVKLKKLFTGEDKFEFKTDSLGISYLVKKVETAPRYLPKDEAVFFVVEEMPEFPGGDLALRKYIASTVKYPAEAVNKGIQGKVYVTFTVAKDGNVADVKIARGVDPYLDKEALRVVNELPRWKPGKQKGQAVNVQYTVPINFALK